MLAGNAELYPVSFYLQIIFHGTLDKWINIHYYTYQITFVYNDYRDLCMLADGAQEQIAEFKLEKSWNHQKTGLQSSVSNQPAGR